MSQQSVQLNTCTPIVKQTMEQQQLVVFALHLLCNYTFFIVMVTFLRVESWKLELNILRSPRIQTGLKIHTRAKHCNDG